MNGYRWIPPAEYGVPKESYGGLFSIFVDYYAVTDSDGSIAAFGQGYGSLQINNHESLVQRRAQAMSQELNRPLSVTRIPLIIVPRSVGEFV